MHVALTAHVPSFSSRFLAPPILTANEPSPAPPPNTPPFFAANPFKGSFFQAYTEEELAKLLETHIAIHSASDAPPPPLDAPST